MKPRYAFVTAIAGFAFGLALFAAAGSPAQAQSGYPNKQITYILPYSAGGSTDVSARVLTKIAAGFLGQPIVVINKPGAGGAVGLAEVVNAAPDGYTIGTFNAIIGAILPHMQKIPFDPVKDVTPIMAYGAYSTFIGVLAEKPWKTLKDLVEYAKANPKVLTVGVSAIGASSHLGMARLMAENGTKVTFVPFGGGAPATAALLGGHLAAGVVSSEILPHVRAGKVRLLAVLQNTKLEEFPDLKNIRELGYGWDLNSWVGVAGPKGMDPAVVKTLVDALTKAKDTPEFKKMMKDLALLETYADSKGTSVLLKNSYEEFGKVVKDLGIGLYAK